MAYRVICVLMISFFSFPFYYDLYYYYYYRSTIVFFIIILRPQAQSS